MAIRVVRLGTPRSRGEGPRLGTVRRPPRQLIELLARLSHQVDFSLGCYCEREDRCHRSVLREMLRQEGARLARR